LFRAGDDADRAPQTVVLSDAYWRRHFGGADDAIGATMDDRQRAAHTVVGVLAANFPLSGSLLAGQAVDLYLPLTLMPEDIGAFMAVIGRLAPGVSAEQARAELAVQNRVTSVGPRAWMTNLRRTSSRSRRSPPPASATGCCSCSALVALCVAARVRQSRQPAPGAGHRAPSRAAGPCGARGNPAPGLSADAGGKRGHRWNRRRAPPWRWPRVHRICCERPHGWRCAAVGNARRVGGGGICLRDLRGTAVLFGTLPLLHLRHRDVLDGLRPAPSAGPDRRAVFAQRSALAIQVAFALVLTTAGGLLVRSIVTLLAVDPGFRHAGRDRHARRSRGTRAAAAALPVLRAAARRGAGRARACGRRP
jgi:hypothetical protein